jgi:hypothetical protein
VLKRIFGPKRTQQDTGKNNNEQKFRVFRTLVMEAARTSETSVDIYLTTRQYIPEDSELLIRRRENLKSQIMSRFMFYILHHTLLLSQNQHEISGARGTHGNDMTRV